MKSFLFSLSLFLVTSININAQNWQTNFEEARSLADAEEKPIVLVFQGSDWCAPCIKLDKEIWSSEEFKEYSEDNFVLVQADFPRRKKNTLTKSIAEQNANLAEAYNKQGIFPFVVILDAQGNVLGQTGYKKIEPVEYIALIESFIKS